MSTQPPLDIAFRAAVGVLQPQAPSDLGTPALGALWTLFEAQATSRHLDFVARELQQQGQAFYTIGSAGHESNALVASALRPSDPALLHYRSGGFYVARAQQVVGSTPIRDVLQGLMGLADEPIAGGRHKVFGHPDLAVIPQTSTIASHLPRAVGLALSLHRARRLKVASPWPDDAVVVTSFGDASANHSSATGAINAAVNSAYRGLPTPILFVCEDNGLGISVPTPTGWIASAYGSRPGLTYVAVDGTDPVGAAAAISTAVADVRTRRRPVFLHLATVRFLAHAGSDVEVAYRSPRAVEADYARDPLVATARALVERGMTPELVLGRYDAVRLRVDSEAATLVHGRRLASAPEVMNPLAPRHPAQVAARVAAGRGLAVRGPADPVPLTLAESINATLASLLANDPRVLVFGEDVGVKGGVYGVTRGLARRFGAARVFDTILDEQSILGLGLGAGLAGLIPIPEIQYLAYLHNAEDQIRGEAASLSFFSQGAFTNPMVVRVAGLAYQKGFGGHFHNDNAVAVLRDIPGLVVACPSRGDDAAAMLRTCVAAATESGAVCVFLEPIALYHRRDLHTAGDGAWLTTDVPAMSSHVPIGRARLHPPANRQRADASEHPGTVGDRRDMSPAADLCLVTFGNGVPMSLRVAARLAERGIAAEVLDLRWLAPLPVTDVLEAAVRTGRILVVDETRHSGGVGEGVITALVEGGFTGPMARVSSLDSFIPLGVAAQHVLLGEDEIEEAATALAARLCAHDDSAGRQCRATEQDDEQANTRRHP